MSRGCTSMVLDFSSPREAMNFYLRHVHNQAPCEVYVNELVPLDNFVDKSSTKKYDIIFDNEPKIFQMTDLEFYTLLRNGEEEISGETAVRRAWEYHLGLSLSDARYLLDNQAKIPVALQNRNLNLYGTILRAAHDGDGDTVCIPQLVFDDGCWQLTNRWIGDEFRSYDLVPDLSRK